MATVDMGGAAVRLSLGSSIPVSHNVAWAEVYFRTKWCLHPSSRLTIIDMDRKLRALMPPLGGTWTPSNRTSPGLRFTSIRSGPKSGSRGLWLSFWGSWVPIEHAPGSRPTSIPSGILVRPTVWPQRTLAENWGAVPI